MTQNLLQATLTTQTAINKLIEAIGGGSQASAFGSTFYEKIHEVEYSGIA